VAARALLLRPNLGAMAHRCGVAAAWVPLVRPNLGAMAHRCGVVVAWAPRGRHNLGAMTHRCGVVAARALLLRHGAERAERAGSRGSLGTPLPPPGLRPPGRGPRPPGRGPLAEPVGRERSARSSQAPTGSTWTGTAMPATGPRSSCALGAVLHPRGLGPGRAGRSRFGSVAAPPHPLRPEHQALEARPSRSANPGSRSLRGPASGAGRPQPPAPRRTDAGTVRMAVRMVST
jgi:hypothetical protein